MLNDFTLGRRIVKINHANNKYQRYRTTNGTSHYIHYSYNIVFKFRLDFLQGYFIIGFMTALKCLLHLKQHLNDPSFNNGILSRLEQKIQT